MDPESEHIKQFKQQLVTLGGYHGYALSQADLLLRRSQSVPQQLPPFAPGKLLTAARHTLPQLSKFTQLPQLAGRLEQGCKVRAFQYCLLLLTYYNKAEHLPATPEARQALVDYVAAYQTLEQAAAANYATEWLAILGVRLPIFVMSVALLALPFSLLVPAMLFPLTAIACVCWLGARIVHNQLQAQTKRLARHTEAIFVQAEHLATHLAATLKTTPPSNEAESKQVVSKGSLVWPKAVGDTHALPGFALHHSSSDKPVSTLAAQLAAFQALAPQQQARQLNALSCP